MEEEVIVFAGPGLSPSPSLELLERVAEFGGNHLAAAGRGEDLSAVAEAAVGSGAKRKLTCCRWTEQGPTPLQKSSESLDPGGAEMPLQERGRRPPPDLDEERAAGHWIQNVATAGMDAEVSEPPSLLERRRWVQPEGGRRRGCWSDAAGSGRRRCWNGQETTAGRRSWTAVVAGSGWRSPLGKEDAESGAGAVTWRGKRCHCCCWNGTRAAGSGGREAFVDSSPCEGGLFDGKE